MANFQLNEEDGMATISSRRPKKKAGISLTDKMVNWGLVKDAAQAKIFMIIFLVIGFGLIIYMNIQTFSSPAEDAVDSMQP